MNANEWLKTMEQAEDYPKGMTPLILKYGEMLIDEFKIQNIENTEDVSNATEPSTLQSRIDEANEVCMNDFFKMKSKLCECRFLVAGKARCKRE